VQSFWGITVNVVKVQVLTAVITYCTVATIKDTLKINKTNYEKLQILSPTLLTKPLTNRLFENDIPQITNNDNHNQLILF
jgi:hypothetical protein